MSFDEGWWATLERVYWEEGGIETILADYLPSDSYNDESLLSLIAPLPDRLYEYIKTRNPIIREYMELALSLVPPWYESEYGESFRVMRELVNV